MVFLTQWVQQASAKSHHLRHMMTRRRLRRNLKVLRSQWWCLTAHQQKSQVPLIWISKLCILGAHLLRHRLHEMMHPQEALGAWSDWTWWDSTLRNQYWLDLSNMLLRLVLGPPFPFKIHNAISSAPSGRPQESSAAPESPSTDAMLPPTLPPAGAAAPPATGAAASATAAAGIAVTPPSPAGAPNLAPQPAMSVPTVAPLKPAPVAPVATLAPVPTLAPVATVAPAGLPLKPLLPVASAGPLRFREQGADAKPVAESGSAAAELQGGHGRRSISDWLVVSGSDWFSEMANEKKSPQIEGDANREY